MNINPGHSASHSCRLLVLSVKPGDRAARQQSHLRSMTSHPSKPVLQQSSSPDPQVSRQLEGSQVDGRDVYWCSFGLLVSTAPAHVSPVFVGQAGRRARSAQECEGR